MQSLRTLSISLATKRQVIDLHIHNFFSPQKLIYAKKMTKCDHHSVRGEEER